MDEALSWNSTSKELGLWFTNSCNLNCSYCYIHCKTEDTISVDRAVDIISRYLSEPGIPVDILFMGAEPLTRFDELRQIVDRVQARTWNRGYHFTAATNGTLLTDEMKDWFTANRDRISLGLSYDGLDSDQDQNRSLSSAKIDKEFFLRTWPLQPWKVTISRDTAANIDKGLIQLHEMGVHFTANPAYEEEPWSDEQVHSYELAMYRLADYYVSHPDVKVCNLLDGLPKPLERPEETPQEAACGAGGSLVFYDMTGAPYPCHMLSPLVLPMDRTIRGECLPENAELEDPRCRSCPLKCGCPTCMGANHVYRGDIRLRDPLHCRLFQAEVRATVHMWIGLFQGQDGYSAEEREIISRLKSITEAFDNGAVGMRQ